MCDSSSSLTSSLSSPPLFLNQLGDEDIFESFQAVLGKTKKFAKPELKEAVAELEKKILEAHNKV